MKCRKRIALLALVLALTLTCAAQAEFIFTDAPKGQTKTKEEIWQEKGIFDFSRLSNVASAREESVGGSRRSFRVYFEDEVFLGGSEGYSEAWLTTGGIMTEMDVDLDGDGTEEYFIYYADSHAGEYGWNVTELRCGVYAQENGGYVPVADWLSGRYYGNCEDYVQIVPQEKGFGILVGSVSYWDGMTAGTTNTVYRYDGKQVRAALMSFATTDVYYSFVAMDVPAEDVCEVFEAMDYEYDAARLAPFGLIEGRNLFVYEYEYGSENYKGCDYLTSRGIEAVADELRRQGVLLYLEEEGAGADYRICVTGGQIVWHAQEQYDPEVRRDYDELQFVSKLDYPMSGTPESDLPVEFEEKLAFGGTHKAAEPAPQPKDTGTVVTTGSVNLRSGPGLGYDKITAVSTGKTLTYLGETSVDDRGVAWYLVDYKGSEVWISSRYSYLK